MSADDLTFAPADFLRLIEEAGLTGSWAWIFASGAQTWSPGLFRLLGLDPAAARPGYDLLTGLVHPDDRLNLASAADLLQGHALPEQRVRVMRPDGTLRTLTMRTELHLSPDGRPRAAAGIVLDVTDQAALLQLRHADLRRRNAWFAQARVVFVSVGAGMSFDFPPQAARLAGRPPRGGQRRSVRRRGAGGARRLPRQRRAAPDEPGLPGRAADPPPQPRARALPDPVGPGPRRAGAAWSSAAA